MKKLIAILAILLIPATATAADVAITITIPDAYVQRLADAVNGTLSCTVVDENGDVIDTLNTRQCFTRWLKNQTVDFINQYEENVAESLGDDAKKSAIADYESTHPKVPVQ